MDNKNEWIRQFKIRIKKWVLEVIEICENLNNSKSSKVFSYQLIKSASSTGANYNAACKARSKKEFFAKLSITIEEADESEYWLDLILARDMYLEKSKVEDAKSEALEILKILSTSRANIKF